MTADPAVRWFSELGVHDTATAGGKGANLGELTRAGLPVPPGFVITAQAYLRSIEHAGLRRHLIEAVADAPIDDPAALSELAASLTELIRDLDLPVEVAEPVLAAFRQLGEGAVAVRSSATSEDTDGTSFAGMNESFTNVHDESELLTCIKGCWASAYGARVIAYRIGQHVTDEPAMAVVIQTMVAAERSGVVFSADPRTGDREHVVIEGAFGLGEVVGGGQLVPDTYVLDSAGPRLLEIRIGYKDHQIITGADGRDQRVDLSMDEATRRVLDDAEAVALAQLALRVQEHYGSPQDIEWAIQAGTTYLVQSRPITTLDRSAALDASAGPVPVRGQLVVGQGAAPGVASGPVRILSSPDHADQFRDGEILVAPMTSPDWMPILRRAAALVTDGGGVTCHAAIVSRELGIPSIVGTRTATHVLHDGQLVTVDGRRGVVEEGVAPVQSTTKPEPREAVLDRPAGRVVVGYDGSPDSCAALDWAAAEAQRRNRSLTVLHVVDTLGQLHGTIPTVPHPERVIRVAGQPAEMIAAEGVHRARKSADAIDITAITHVSRVAYSLIENSRDAALLVVGTRGHGELGGALLGSVSFAVSGHALCPVVVVRGDTGHAPGPDRPVVVGVDASPGSEAALRFAADTADTAGAPLIVVTAYQAMSTAVWLEPGTGDDGIGRSFDIVARQAADQVGRAAVQAAVQRRPALDVQHRIVQAPATTALSAAGTGAGLLVVGTRGGGGFAGLRLGSVSHSLIHSGPVPVAVVPGPEDPD